MSEFNLSDRTLPGPCYPNWPSTRGAMARHRLDVLKGTCHGCDSRWTELLLAFQPEKEEVGS